MRGIIHFIKKELIFFVISLSVFLVVFNLYQSQKKFTKKQDIANLKFTIERQKRVLANDISKYYKEKQFEKKIKNLKIIDVPISLDIYKVGDSLKKDFFTYFGIKSIRIKYRPIYPRVGNIKHYVFYQVNMDIPYINKYQILSFFNYLTNKYFYLLGGIRYNTSNQTFKITIYLLGKKGKERRARRFYY